MMTEMDEINPDPYEIAYESGYAAGKQKGMESQVIGLAALQLLRELGVSPSSVELIDAYRRFKQCKNLTEQPPCAG